MSRPATPGEQLANSLSHGLGLLLAVCALPFLVLEARSGGGLPVAGAAVFAVSGFATSVLNSFQRFLAAALALDDLCREWGTDLATAALHFSLRDLMSVRAIAIPGAVAQIAVATLLGWGLAMLMGWGHVAGLVFGFSLATASTVVLLRAMEESAAAEPNKSFEVQQVIDGGERVAEAQRRGSHQHAWRRAARTSRLSANRWVGG